MPAADVVRRKDRHPGFFRRGDELADTLARGRPDIVLLDIRMPGADVFDVLARVVSAGRALPSVIFATAYDGYAGAPSS